MMNPQQFIWNGRCRERAIQERLCHPLRSMADAFSANFSDHPAVGHFDTILRGRILISPSLFTAEAIPNSALLDPDHEAVQLHPGKTDRFILADEVSAFGIQFHADTGSGYYSRDDDLLSFVFIRSKRYPGLEGAIARLEDRSLIHINQASILQGADFFLTVPHLRVRFIYNFWIEALLTWVYQFFVPEMEIWQNGKKLMLKYFAGTVPGNEKDEVSVLKTVMNRLENARKMTFHLDKKKAERKGKSD